MKLNRIKSITILDDIRLSGYEGEYIFEKIAASKTFYEHPLLEKWFLGIDTSVVYDIGANIGNHTVYFAKLSPRSQIFAFEPVPSNFAMLEKNISDNGFDDRIKTYPMAVGETAGSVSMSIMQEGNYGTATVLDNDETIDIDAHNVDLVAIDDLNLPAPDFIKIDVEGYELAVLKGMKNTLENAENLIVWIEIDEKTASQVYDFMTDLGFGVMDLALEQNSNVLWCNQKDRQVQTSSIFRNLLMQSEICRQRFWDVSANRFKFIFEQEKANDLTEQLKSMTSKYEYEQGKANDLIERLKSMTSKFTYEQNKANELIRQAQVMQKELDMFRNSKMIKFLRFWIWHMPSVAKRKIRLRMNRFGAKLYVKLLPYPRVRAFLSRANGKLKIYKNPQVIVAPSPKVKPQLPSPSSARQSKLPGKMNVAMIVDDFTFNSFQYECNALPLEPDNWQKIFEKNDIDFFFCESAWAGVDSLQRPWRGKIYASINFPKENRNTLLEILSHCKKNRIPTVFWNKEDPAHYEDKVHDFVKTALEFDHIFTTSVECVELYKQEHGHKNVNLLMFATQPRLFNPIETFDRTEEIIFAGSWYKQHPTRCSEMSDIFDAILKSPHMLKIYDRHSENGDPNHVFPSRYLPYIHPRLPHDQLAVAYKGSKYALNLNTVTESDTMFARRAFELMSSNTLVVSNYSKGLAQLFGDNVAFTDGTSPLDLLETDKKREQCLYAVLHHHTYRHRFEQILKDIGIPYLDATPLVTLYYNVASIESASIATKHFHAVDWDNKQCVLVLDKDCNPSELQSIVCSFNLGTVTVRSDHYDETYHSASKNEIASGYSIQATTELNYDFVKKAFSHTFYLEKNTAVVSGQDKYTFVRTKEKTNVLISSEYIDSTEFIAYVI